MIDRPLVTVGGLIVAPDHDILLVRSKKWSDLYSVPGGKVERGENREAAFEREIWEETGLKLTHIRFAMVQDCIFSPEFWHSDHFVMNDFIADLHPQCKKDNVILNEEAYEFLWIKPEKALKLPLHRECRYLIEWYLTHEKKRLTAIIGVDQHAINCKIGINPEEFLEEQTIYVDIKVRADVTTCVQTERIEDTVNYVYLAEICTRLAQSKHYQLIETLAAEILDQFFENFSISWAWIRIKKPAALSSAHYTFIELERDKEGVR